MAADAVVEIANPFALVTGDSLALIVAGIAVVSQQVIGVAIGAGGGAAVRKREVMGLVELPWRPCCRGVAVFTICTEQAVMESWVRVASGAVLRSSFENVIDVAFFTGDVGMRTGQLERRLRVVKRGFFPIIGCMATGAILAKLALVCVDLRMAGIAILRGAFENIVDMAFLAGHLDVRRGQLEGGLGVIERCFFPILWRMAGSAIFAEATLVSVIFGMARSAIRGCGFQFSNRVGLAVAFVTWNVVVFASQLERDFTMVKILSVGIQPIMAGQAAGPKGLQVVFRE